MLTYTIGVIGIWAGLAALVLNIAGMRATPASLDSRKRRFLALCASVFGLAVCSVTFVIGVQGFTVEGPILVYGWPFPAATTDRFAAPMGTDGFVRDVYFWLLAPQILVYLYQRLLRGQITNP